MNDEDPIKKLMIIYMSDHGAWVMGHSTELFMDGTFDSRPSHFAQLYFIRAKMADKRSVPVAFALLPNKEAANYRKMWEIIKSLVVFQPDCPMRVTSDFEKAAIICIKENFPQASFSGCFFHYKQALYRQCVMLKY
jgi:hypothetical protein